MLRNSVRSIPEAGAASREARHGTKMAIHHLSVRPVRRSTGRSAVAAAAYRAGALLRDARTGLSHDFRRKGGVAASGIALPRGVDAPWALDRGALWNAAEAAERRRDARTAQEVEVALPAELSEAGRRRLAEDLARHLAEGHGCAADWAVHAPPRDGDGRNHHAHILMTVRALTAEGLGGKILLEREAGWLRRRGLPTGPERVRALRAEWADMANAALAREGHGVRIDHRSHAARGLSVPPTRHMGVAATALARRGEAVEREALGAEARARSLAAPGLAEDLLRLVAEGRSVFRRPDVERAAWLAAGCAPGTMGAVEAVTRAALASPELVRLRAGPGSGPELLTTRRTVALETGMARLALRLRGARTHGVPAGAVARALAASAASGHRLPREQAAAVRHVTGPERIALVAGAAGTGKSTVLAAARDAWERAGHRVVGAALSGKAADGLEASSGIASRTLSSWALRRERGADRLGPGDVLVVDEAGMLGTAQLAAVLGEVARRGAKAVLVGDAEQLQPVGAGAAFRALAERCGTARLSRIRRQRSAAHRRASGLFASARTAEGLETYRREGAIVWDATREGALAALAGDLVLDALERPEGSRLALAHRRADVRDINLLVREGLRAAGLLPEGGAEVTTVQGAREFAAGDRVAFLANDARLGVRNGSLGTVEAAAASPSGDVSLRVRLDGGDGGGGRTVAFGTGAYGALDHGYAVTVHRAQGATVDRTFAFAGATMDRHLAYVAMTRHRDTARLYAAREAFGGFGPLARRLSRSGLAANALDHAGFLARRGLAGWLHRAGRGLRRGLEALAGAPAPALPSLAEAFPRPAEGSRAPLPETTLTDAAVARLRARTAEAGHGRAEREREAAGRARSGDRDRSPYPEIGMGM